MCRPGIMSVSYQTHDTGMTLLGTSQYSTSLAVDIATHPFESAAQPVLTVLHKHWPWIALHVACSLLGRVPIDLQNQSLIQVTCPLSTNAECILLHPSLLLNRQHALQYHSQSLFNSFFSPILSSTHRHIRQHHQTLDNSA